MCGMFLLSHSHTHTVEMTVIPRLPINLTAQDGMKERKVSWLSNVQAGNFLFIYIYIYSQTHTHIPSHSCSAFFSSFRKQCFETIMGVGPSQGHFKFSLFCFKNRNVGTVGTCSYTPSSHHNRGNCHSYRRLNCNLSYCIFH